MDEQPISLAAARESREARTASEHLRCEKCGGEWWTTDVVIDSNTMKVVGYVALMACVGCQGE